MFTKVIVTILLWCWFYSGVRGKEESLCSKILLRKSYYNAAERMIAQVNVSKGKMNYIYLCGGVTKFTYHLFQDPEALLCAEPIRDYVINREKEFKYARVKCQIKRDVFLDLACEPAIHDFHTCIQTHMKFTLKGLAFKETPDENACEKCREAHFVKFCSANIKKQRSCKKLYHAINSDNIEGKSCGICIPNGVNPNGVNPNGVPNDPTCLSAVGDLWDCIERQEKFTFKGIALKGKSDACTKCQRGRGVKLCVALIKRRPGCKPVYAGLNFDKEEEKWCGLCDKTNDVDGREALTGVKQNAGYSIIIVGSVVGGILLIPAAVVLITYIRRKRKNNKDAEDKTRDPDVSDVKNGKSLRSRATTDKAPSGSRSNCAETDLSSALSSKSRPSKVSNRYY